MTLKITLTWLVISLAWMILSVLFVDTSPRGSAVAALFGGLSILSFVASFVASFIAVIWILPIP